MAAAFKPYISAQKKVAEFSFRASFLGLTFGFLFAIANAYLALKIGQTVSASIPAAIMSMGLMKLFFRKVSVLEHNIVQTIATVGEGLAAGVIFTIPSLFLLGETPSVGRIFLLSSLGGILGILFMIPMRRYIIVEEHKTLPFPEGTACSEILIAGEKTGKSALMALWGLFASISFKIGSSVLLLWKESPSWTFSWFQKATFSLEATPALLGVGYIIGSRITGMMFAGGIMAWWVLIPLIKMFGLGNLGIYPSDVPISEMSSDAIWGAYIRYIGAGTVAIGGFAGLIRIAPLLWKTAHVGVKELFYSFSQKRNLERTDLDISMSWLILGSLAIVLTLWLFPGLPMNLFTIVLLVVLGFFFVAVTSLTVGLVGSSSNPVSGMTITTLLLTCIIFVLLGWTERAYLISAITMGCVSCVAICMAGTTSQDLKTGFLLGATPRSQQIAEILGVLLPSFALGYTLYLLNEAYGIGSAQMPAPQATLMAIIAEGVIGGDLPYALVGIGALIGVVALMLGIPILPFALGLYLPLSLSSATFVGGVVRFIVNRSLSTEESQDRGTLLASGFIGGDALTGILIAFLTLTGVLASGQEALLPDWASLALYLLLAAGLGFFSLFRQKEQPYS